LFVALCRETDAVLEPLLFEHPGCQVVVAPREVSAAACHATQADAGSPLQRSDGAVSQVTPSK
jgi:hypothetical protein